MHFLEKKAQEWLDITVNPKMSQLNEFCDGNKDLKTMIRVLMNDSNMESFINDPNKNDLTDFDKNEAIKHYLAYPKWFFVFCKKDLATLDLLYKLGDKELSLSILDNEVNNNQYISQLVENFIFNKQYQFEVKYLIQPNSIYEMLYNIDPLVADLNQVSLTDDSVKNKMVFFKLNDFINPRIQSLQNLSDNITSKMQLLKNSNKEFENKSEDEIFLALMPSIIPIKGVYILEKNQIDYIVQNNFLSYIDTKSYLYCDAINKKKSEKKKQLIENIFNGISIASFFFLPQEAIKHATMSMIEKITSNGGTILENMGNAKDMLEVGKSVFSDFLNLNDAEKLYKAFQKSEHLSFQDFFIEQLRQEISYFLLNLFHQPIHLNESIYIDIYRQFFDKQIFPHYEKLKEDKEALITLNDQIKNYITDQEKETFMLNCIFNCEPNANLNSLN